MTRLHLWAWWKLACFMVREPLVFDVLAIYVAGDAVGLWP